jgi:hypothetical protein
MSNTRLTPSKADFPENHPNELHAIRGYIKVICEKHNRLASRTTLLLGWNLLLTILVLSK